MSKVDWSLATEGATHVSRTGTFFKFDVIGLMGISHTYLDGAWRSIGYLLEDYNEPCELTERPQPKPWSGSQDGLPPVGTVCEVREVKMLPVNPFEEWSKCKVVAHNTGYSGDPQVCTIDDSGDFAIFYPATDGTEFREIKTPQQIAASARETAIREIMDIADVDCRVTAARLVDAGFKREVV